MKTALVFMTLSILLIGTLVVLTAFNLTENNSGAAIMEPIELSFVQSGREAHKVVKFYDRDQGELLFEALNPQAKSRRWYQIDPEGSIVLPEHIIQASVAVQKDDFWTSPSRPVFDTANAFASLWNRSKNIDNDSGIVELIAEAQVLPLGFENSTDPAFHAMQRQLATAEMNGKYSRVELLEIYINTADYGNLAYGIDAAALVYFGKHAASLSLSEAALLAPIPFDPEINPFDAPDESRERQRALLVEMREVGIINHTEFQRALAEELEISAPHVLGETSLAEYLIDAFEKQFGRAALGRNGLQVITTIDADLQTQSECVLAVHLARLNHEEGLTDITSDCLASALLPPLRPGDASQDHEVREGAVVVLDASTGEVLSLVGDSQRQRPMGSIAQPFVYLTAFAEGYSPGSMVMDLPVGPVGRGSENPEDKEFGGYHGPVRIRTAMANGYKNAAEQIVDLVGVESVLSIFETMGVNVTKGTDTELDLWRGNLLDLVHASSVFAQKGVAAGLLVNSGLDSIEPIVLAEILDGRGRLIYSMDVGRKAVLSEQLAYLVEDVLSDESARFESLGSSNPLEINRPAAALTDVTVGGREAWALGFTPTRVVGVWMGNSSGLAPPGLTPRNSAAPVWHAIMKYATRDLTPEDWSMPPGITRIEVCDPSGLLPTIYCPETVREPFLSGTEPTTFDNLFQPYLVNKETGKLATLSTPVELVEERVFLVPPPEAIGWAEAVGIEKPPQEYDTLTEGESQDPGLRLISPDSFAFLRGEVRVRGFVDLEELDFYRLQVGKGLNPLNWIQLSEDRSTPVRGGTLAEWDTSELEGLYTLQLIAVETDEQVRTASVHVTVDNEPPFGEIVYPEDGQVFVGTRTEEVAIEIEALDSFGIERVVIFIDGEEFATLSQEPYSIRWPMQFSGSHTFRAEVYDLAGNMVETDIRSFEITRP
jgi:membrane peptidoglycan carboxypeptidase